MTKRDESHKDSSMPNGNINKDQIKQETIEFNGPLEFKGSLTEDNKRYLVDALFITPKDSRFKS